MRYVVLNERGRVIVELDDEDVCSDARCGGCDNCLLRQAYHADMTVEEFDVYQKRISRMKANWPVEGF